MSFFTAGERLYGEAAFEAARVTAESRMCSASNRRSRQ
jgi:hypothetical protein